MRFTGNITPSKLFAVLIIVVGAIAIFKDMEAVTHIAILASAGLYGWRKHEARKMMEVDKKDK